MDLCVLLPYLVVCISHRWVKFDLKEYTPTDDILCVEERSMYFPNKSCLCPTFPKPPPVTANSGRSEFQAVDWVHNLETKMSFLSLFGR